MQRSRSAVVLLLFGFALLVSGCKKEGGSSVISALLPKGAADKLSPDLQVFAEELPGDVEAFGYFDFGKSVDELSKSAMGGSYRGLAVDLLEMTKRRWGVDASKATGVGVIIHQKQPVFAIVAPAQEPKPGEDVGDVLLAKMGRLAIFGEPSAVLAVLSSARQAKRLHQTKPMWLRAALTRAGGNLAFFSGNVEPFLSEAPRAAQAQLADLTDATATVGTAGLGVYLSCKPGRAEAVKGLIEAGLGMAKGQLARLENDLGNDKGGPLMAVLVRHYSQAFFKSLEQKVSGDEVALSLGWHMPVLPKLQGAALAERVVAPGEVGFAQLNFGAPILEILIATTDFLKSPLDRAALRKELSAELAKLTGTAGFDPRAATISGSLAGFFVSLHNAAVGQPGQSVPVPLDALAAVATKWGLAVTQPEQRDALTAAVTAPTAGLAADSTVLSDDETALLRGSVDITKLPMMPQVPAITMMRQFSASMGEKAAVVEVLTQPGQAKAFVAEVDKLVAQLAPDVDAAYAARAKSPVEMELMAIMQHWQHQQMLKVSKPSSVDGDRVRYRMEYDYYGQMRLMMVASSVGVAAAVAIPLYMTFQVNAATRQMQQVDQQMQVDQQELEKQMKEMQDQIDAINSSVDKSGDPAPPNSISN